LVVEVVQVMEEVVVQYSDRTGGDDGLDTVCNVDTVDEEMSVSVVGCCWTTVLTLPDKVVGVFAVFGHASVAKVLLLSGSSSL
jgi:hypothetical protein